MKTLIKLIIYVTGIICLGFLYISCSQQDIMTLLTTDNLPPTIVSITPTNNETQVPVETSITIIFSEEMDIDSAVFAFHFFKIIPGGETPLWGGTQWEESRILTFTPNNEQEQAQPMDYLTEYRIYITEAAKDKQGNNLEESYNSTFLTIGNFGVAVGNTHTLFLKNSGEMLACGANGSYQTGIDEDVDPKHEIQNIPDILQIKSIGCGIKFSLAVSNVGEVYGWGDNVNKQLGAQSDGSITMPKLIEDISNVAAVGGGLNFSIALKDDNTVFAWGNSSNGVLGCDPLPSPNYRETPGSVLNDTRTPLSDIIKIAVGYGHTLALNSNNRVVGWGNNNVGQLAQTEIKLPDLYASYAIEINLPSDVIKVAAGIQHSAALLNTGEVMTWGRNDHGQLGTDQDVGVTEWQYIPNYIVKMSDKSRLDNIVNIETGISNNTFAIDSNGTVWFCGANTSAQAGNGTTLPEYYNSAVPIPGLPSNIVKITAAQFHVCAITEEGDTYAWGSNYYGQTGINNPDPAEHPVKSPRLIINLSE